MGRKTRSPGNQEQITPYDVTDFSGSVIKGVAASKIPGGLASKEAFLVAAMLSIIGRIAITAGTAEQESCLSISFDQRCDTAMSQIFLSLFLIFSELETSNTDLCLAASLLLETVFTSESVTWYTFSPILTS